MDKQEQVAEAREMFDRLIAQADSADRVAALELCREYFTNPEFRVALQDEVFRINSAAQVQQ